MPDTEQIDRIAAAMNALRPDWRVSSLVTFLTNHHANRPYRDLAIAAAAVAADPRTTTPQLLNQHGAWWVAAQVAAGTTPGLHYERCPVVGHTSYAAHNCGACANEDRVVEVPITDAPTEEHLEMYTRGARNARRAAGINDQKEASC